MRNEKQITQSPSPSVCPSCGRGYHAANCQEWDRAATTEHEPVAQGGEGEWRADSSGGWGYVWQGGACLAKCPEPSRAEQIVTEHNQHRSLLAERERYAQLLRAAKKLIAMNNCNYDRAVMRSQGGFNELQKAIDAIDQKEGEG